MTNRSVEKSASIKKKDSEYRSFDKVFLVIVWEGYVAKPVEAAYHRFWH